MPTTIPIDSLSPFTELETTTVNNPLLGKVEITRTSSPFSPLIDPLVPIISASPIPIISTKSPIFPALSPNFVTSINLVTDQTVPVLSFYEDLNYDPRAHDIMIKYFYYKVLDQWLYDEMSDILGYFRVSGNKVTLGPYKANTKMTVDQIEAVADYLDGSKIFNKKFVKKILYKHINDTGINWYDLTKRDYGVRKKIQEKLVKNIKEAL